MKTSGEYAVRCPREEFRARVTNWSKRLRVQPTQVRVQHMVRKWASCSTAGWVSFSDDLLTQAQDFQDYVIAHELLHLKIPNHGKLFKSLLSANFPRWREFDIHR